ncbi:periplasmic heavy metal sensor [Granulicella sp. WH15]|uniref:Spy/CpxP family protein refolding chaperone n=1 Tax=Granulicella sp. WH15 TaxID=2602070 RepID=UPI001366E41D|nr:Spy/CpxP family protein refolding chaperone [Granulicella sp. WH15]QHN05023.1 periplasmic heavy metal sensor [Granulicella sp. WH15]
MTTRGFVRLATLALLTGSLAAYAQGPMRSDGPPPFRGGEMGGGFHHGPGGMWWKNPEIATKLGLTADQQKRMEDIFLQSKVQLIHIKAELEEQELMLEPLMNANPPDSAKALAQIGKIADTRAELEKANAKMLFGIRGVLTAAQWTTLHEMEHNRFGGRGFGGRGEMGGSSMRGRGGQLGSKGQGTTGQPQGTPEIE